VIADTSKTMKNSFWRARKIQMSHFEIKDPRGIKVKEKEERRIK
jgi:hypothetical protein